MDCENNMIADGGLAKAERASDAVGDACSVAEAGANSPRVRGSCDGETTDCGVLQALIRCNGSSASSERGMENYLHVLKVSEGMQKCKCGEQRGATRW